MLFSPAWGLRCLPGTFIDLWQQLASEEYTKTGASYNTRFKNKTENLSNPLKFGIIISLCCFSISRLEDFFFLSFYFGKLAGIKIESQY